MSTQVGRKNVIEKVDWFTGPNRVPFSSLCHELQEHTRSRVSFGSSDISGQLPAICLTRLAKFSYLGHDETYYLPHHLILVTSSMADTLLGHIGVAYEIGHLVLHFSRYADPLIDGALPDESVGEHGEIRYTVEEEMEASVFATALCLRPRGHEPGITHPSKDAILTELINVFRARATSITDSWLKELSANIEEIEKIASPVGRLKQISVDHPDFLSEAMAVVSRIRAKVLPEDLSELEADRRTLVSLAQSQEIDHRAVDKEMSELIHRIEYARGYIFGDLS